MNNAGWLFGRFFCLRIPLSLAFWGRKRTTRQRGFEVLLK
jgi:hypothetical protein